MMADENQSIVGRFLSSLASPFRRRTTPQPQMPLYTTGIQEPVLAQGITIPALYAVSNENLILRTVITKLGQEVFRRGYYWEKKWRLKCNECEEEFQHEVDSCSTCGGEVRKPDQDQALYPKWLLAQENSMEQTFIKQERFNSTVLKKSLEATPSLCVLSLIREVSVVDDTRFVVFIVTWLLIRVKNLCVIHAVLV